ncbi:MAG: PHP domain-containing protein [Asgard group archaeon]|nr:PHP domain-containing protein [Asgard group archaeon]
MPNKKKQLLQLLLRYTITVIITLSVIGGSGLLTAKGPREFSYTNDSFNWQFDLDVDNTSYNIVYDHHSHSRYSDGILTIEQNILWHLAHGFNAISITDHNTMVNKVKIASMAEKYQDKIVMILGMEWTTRRVHLNLLGITNTVHVPSDYPTDLEIQEAINATHDQGGVVVADHLPWSMSRMSDHPTRAELLAWGVDYIELACWNEYDVESESWCNNTGGFGKITGTDMHYPINVHYWTLMNATNFTSDDVMDQLRARNTTIYYDESGSWDSSIPVESKRYTLVKPFIEFGRYFVNFEGPNDIKWSSIAIVVSYVTIGFILIESTRFVIRKIIEKKRTSKITSKE